MSESSGMTKNVKDKIAVFEALARKAAKFGFPIRMPADMPEPIITDKPDEEWDQWLRNQWWYNKETIQAEIANSKFMSHRLLELHEKLLSFGGYRTCLPVVEDDLDNILDRGQLWYGEGAMMMRGAPSQCHRNSAACWEANKTRTILCTGYALSEDGLWRQHSWLVNFRNQCIVETTEPRVAYFGFPMTKEEAQTFADDCY